MGAETKERGIYQLKDLGHHSKIFGHNTSSLFERGLRGLHFLHQFLVNRRQARKRLDFIHQTAKRRIGQHSPKGFSLPNGCFQRRHIERFPKKPMGDRGGPHIVGRALVSGQDDADRLWTDRANLPKKLSPVHPRHRHIRHHDIARCLTDRGQGRRSGREKLHRPLGLHWRQCPLQMLQNLRRIVDKDHPSHHPLLPAGSSSSPHRSETA